MGTHLGVFDIVLVDERFGGYWEFQILPESFLRGRPSTGMRRNADVESNGMTFQI